MPSRLHAPAFGLVGRASAPVNSEGGGLSAFVCLEALQPPLGAVYRGRHSIASLVLRAANAGLWAVRKARVFVALVNAAPGIG